MDEARTDRRSDLGQSVLVGALLFAALGIALFHGIQASSGLLWSPSVDTFRDNAWAQAQADGRWYGDAYYAGETVSYVPLVPAMVAVLSVVSGTDVATMYARSGAYLNLLIPLALFLLVARWYGRWAALAAAVAFIFLFNADAEIAATYSPLLLTSGFAQAIFFVTLLAYRASLELDSMKHAVLTGIGLGLVFMTHVCPAVIVGGTVVLCEGLRALRTKHWKRGLQRLGTILGVALVASGPLSTSILVNYRMRVLNPDPAQWTWPKEFSDIPAMLLANLTPLLVFTAIGIVTALRGWRRKPEASILFGWIVVAGSLWLWGFVWQAATRSGWTIPSAPVPTWHFLWYLKTLEPLFFGVGLVAACRWLARKLPERFLPQRWWVAALVSAVLLVSSGLEYHRFGQNFATHRLESDFFAWVVPRKEIVAWIRDNSTTEDVFLTHSAEAWAGILIVGPAGRRIVAPESSMFASPFVDWDARHRDRKLMVWSLRNGDVERFKALASKYGVTYVLASEERWLYQGTRDANPQESGLIIHADFAGLVELAYETRRNPRAGREAVRIYRVSL